jgi:hypothetical protein
MYAVNRLPKRDRSAPLTRCCPKFEPEAWDGQTFQFDNKLFVKVVTRSFLHVPLNMNSVMKKTMQAIDAAGAGNNDEYIMLSYDVSPWESEHYISVDKQVHGAKMVHLSGIYLAKVFEGPFHDANKWYSELADYVKARGKTLIKMFFGYTTCPRCAKKYGKNYVVGFAQIQEPAI